MHNQVDPTVRVAGPESTGQGLRKDQKEICRVAGNKKLGTTRVRYLEEFRMDHATLAQREGSMDLSEVRLWTKPYSVGYKQSLSSVNYRVV
jgi:hypothetical protein